MANLDPRFICTSDVDSYFVDNATGQPMSGGIVTFYSDVNRTVLKSVYQLTGTPGNYIYAPLNNPVSLSSSGTYQDALGNNIALYYYPFTGTPYQNTGVQELYYVVVVNSGLVPQLIRQGWPQAAGSGVTPVSDSEIENYIPNGQFLSHNNIVSLTEPPITQYAFGSQTVDSQAIAQGGWNFVYTDATTAIFNNSFSQIPSSGGWGINSFPKFAFNFVCTSFNANALTRDLRIQWPDVNKFSSGNPPGSTPYTLFFDAKSNDGNSYVFSLYKIYYFGSAGNGGSPSAPISNLIGTFTVGPSQTFVSHNIQGITFPANQGTIGTNGDDYIALSIQGPSSGWNAAFTDFALVQGDETLLSFPVTTNDEMLSRGVAGWMPTPDPSGQDLYLPLILTSQGMLFDHSQVGTIVGKMTMSAVNNELLCDGSQYITSDYSGLGIPYSRLQKVFFNSSENAPLFGTGINFVNAYQSTNSSNENNMVFYTNKINAAQTVPADGAVSTGFTFDSHYNISTAGYNYTAYSNNSGDFTVVANFQSPPHNNNGASGGTSGMTFLNYTDPSASEGNYVFQTQALSASSLAAGSGNPGLYFTFSNATIDYYMWFHVNGEHDPGPGGTGIECELLSTMTIADVGGIISAVLNGFQTNVISTIAASGMTAGCYFIFYANSQQYVVWYEIGGSGTQPTVAGTPIYIKVILTGTETNENVATTTVIAVNSYSFAVPDLRGVFLRGVDASSNEKWDIDQATRVGILEWTNATFPGSLQLYANLTHEHALASINIPQQNTSGGALNTLMPTSTSASTLTEKTYTTTGTFVNFTGNVESRPVNVYVNYFIKY